MESHTLDARMGRRITQCFERCQKGCWLHFWVLLMDLTNKFMVFPKPSINTQRSRPCPMNWQVCCSAVLVSAGLPRPWLAPGLAWPWPGAAKGTSPHTRPLPQPREFGGPAPVVWPESSHGQAMVLTWPVQTRQQRC